MTKTSAISMMPALMACTSSPMPGTSTTTVTSATSRHVHFVLSHADGFDDHAHPARPRDAAARQSAVALRQAAQRAARGHGADEDSRIGVMGLHADAVAQQWRPPVTRLDGSTAMIATVLPLRRAQRPRHGDPPACSCPAPGAIR